MTLGDSFVRVAHGTSVVALMSLIHLLRFSRQSSSSPVFFIAWLNKPEVTRLERAAIGADFRTATPAKIRYQRRDRAPARRTAPGGLKCANASASRRGRARRCDDGLRPTCPQGRRE